MPGSGGRFGLSMALCEQEIFSWSYTFEIVETVSDSNVNNFINDDFLEIRSFVC